MDGLCNAAAEAWREGGRIRVDNKEGVRRPRAFKNAKWYFFYLIGRLEYVNRRFFLLLLSSPSQFDGKGGIKRCSREEKTKSLRHRRS